MGVSHWSYRETGADRAVAGDYPETKQWIDITRKLLDRHDEGILDQAESRMHNEIMFEIHRALENAATIPWTEEVQAALSKIITSTIQLFRLLHRQAARFQVRMVDAITLGGKGNRYNSAYMEDLGNEMEDDEADWEVGIAVFPGIFKWGDERGENVSVPLL